MPYDWRTELPGVFARHADTCPRRNGGVCVCGPLGYRAGVIDPETGERVLSPAFERVADAQVWQRDQEEALWEPPPTSTQFGAFGEPGVVSRPGAYSNGSKPMVRGRVPAPDFETPPEGTRFESLAETRAWQQDQRDLRRAAQETPAYGGDLASFVDEFLRAAEEGRARDRYGGRYGPARVRQLRGALSSAESALGTMRLEDVRHRHLEEMFDELRQSGAVTTDGIASITTALRSLYAYAVQLELVGYSPVVEVSSPSPDSPEREPDAAATAEPEEQEMGAVITDFLAAVEGGRVVRHPGEPYTLESLRELRGALSYVDYELRAMDIRDVRRGHLKALVEDLQAAGVPPLRLLSVVDALQSLYAFAIHRDLVDFSPVVELGLPFDGVVASAQPRREVEVDPPPRARQSALGHEDDWARGNQQEPPNPTAAMLALGAQVAKWTTRVVVIAFILIVLAIGRALGVTEAIPFL